jgi:hypothetical protein
VNIGDLCFHLRNRRRMYLLDDRFSTAVAFVEGYDAALDGAPLRGFGDYVTERIAGHQSNISWPYLVASTAVPEIMDGGMRIDQIPAEVELELTERMLDLIEEYHGQRAAEG